MEGGQLHGCSSQSQSRRESGRAIPGDLGVETQYAIHTQLARTDRGERYRSDSEVRDVLPTLGSDEEAVVKMHRTGGHSHRSDHRGGGHRQRGPGKDCCAGTNFDDRTRLGLEFWLFKADGTEPSSGAVNTSPVFDAMGDHRATDPSAEEQLDRESACAAFGEVI